MGGLVISGLIRANYGRQGEILSNSFFAKFEIISRSREFVQQLVKKINWWGK